MTTPLTEPTRLGRYLVVIRMLDTRTPQSGTRVIRLYTDDYADAYDAWRVVGTSRLEASATIYDENGVIEDPLPPVDS
jgi:hypothetical protein